MSISNIENTSIPEPNSGCWIWIGSSDSYGYGTIVVGGKGRGIKPAGKRELAHRHSWSVYNNSTIEKGKVVMHSCDNPSCVNPNHLSIGTIAENIKDMDRKGRRITKVPYGESHAKAKLTKESAIEIFNSKELGTILSKKFNVSTNVISRIKRGVAWREATKCQ